MMNFLTNFLIYDGKVAVALLVFYLFYRFLLKKETFHQFNRVVLVGTAVLSFLLPLCIITIRKPAEPGVLVMEMTEEIRELAPVVSVKDTFPSWPVFLLILLFWAGAAFVLVRVIVSILSISKIIRQGELVSEEDGCKIVVTDRDIDPFSWMRYIVFSRKDWEDEHASIITHEKAHIDFRHSAELLAVDLLSVFQWFNPAIWMLRADLRELHEYEADDAVLRSGANIKEYQYLLIRKAVSKSGYSVANSFNHSILKNRITMMSKSKSPLARGLRVLYLLPLVSLGIGLQAQTVYVPVGKDSEKNGKIEASQPAFDDDGLSSDAIHLTVSADGKIRVNGQEVTLDQLKDYIKPEKQTVVQFSAEKSVPIGVIEDVRNELRSIGALKLHYTAPSDKFLRTYSLPPALTREAKTGVTELYPGVDRENICVVRINSRDKIFFGNKASQDDEEMLRLGKGFLREHGKDTRFSFQADRGTSYGAYLHMMDLLTQIYVDVREEKALSVYGKDLSKLTPEERSHVNEMVPFGVSEVEMKGSQQK